MRIRGMVGVGLKYDNVYKKQLYETFHLATATVIETDLTLKCLVV